MCAFVLKGPSMQISNAVKALGSAIFLVLAVGCASTPTSGVNDPYENLNRDIHEFNKGVDRYAIRPASDAYDTVTPELVQFLVANALNHLELPRDFANNLLSGRWEPAALTFARFGINTLVGAGGLLDPATDVGVNKQDADFGLTLATYGAAEGIYYEIPLLGPTTVRDTVGRVVDIAFAPTTYVGGPIVGATETGLRIADTRQANRSAIDNALYESPDSYLTARTFYLQSRRARARQLQGLPPADLNGEGDLDIEPAQ